MHETLLALTKELGKVIAQVQSSVPNDEPLGNAHGNWSFPGLTRSELVEEAQSIIDLIEDRGSDEVAENEPRLQDYIRRLQHLRQHTVGQLWGNAAAAVPAYLLTLTGLRKALAPALSKDAHADGVRKLKKLTTQLRSMEARLTGLDPRTATLETMVDRVEQAYNAADQLPTDLESLSEARKKIADLLTEAARDQGEISEKRNAADKLDKQLGKIAADATAVLERCETAYSAATSVGLAAAFSERSNTLSRSIWFWVFGLIVALASGSYFGSSQLRMLSQLFRIPDTPTSIITLNLLLSMLSVGAPVWFAWLATKQIGQRFRLSEDYAFKASISRAYEGFRREAARFDKDMEAKLLSSALTRLDELPLRLIETDTHGSPWHEIASSDVVKRAMSSVPGFAGQVRNLASNAISATSTARRSPNPKTKVIDEPVGDENRGDGVE